VEGVRPPKAAKPLPKALSVDRRWRWPTHAGCRGPEATRPGARDHAIVELLYGCGLRVAELLGLDLTPRPRRRGWIDAADATAHVLGKGSKRRSVPVGAAGRALPCKPGWHVRASLANAEEPALFVSRRGTRLTAGQLRNG
jgi:integrase/recombinase XerC